MVLDNFIRLEYKAHSLCVTVLWFITGKLHVNFGVIWKRRPSSPGFEPGIFWSVVRCVIHCATSPIYKKSSWHVCYPVKQRCIISVTLRALLQCFGTVSVVWLSWQVSRDRIVVSTSRCGRDNPGSNPGHGRAVKVSVMASWLFYLH